MLSPDTQAQTYFGTILDQRADALEGAHIQDTVFGDQTFTDNFGRFQLQVQQQSVLRISFVGYSTKYLRINQLPDSTRHYIKLSPKTDQLREVVVSSDRMEPMVRKGPVNVIDYLPFPDFVIALKTQGSKRLVSIEVSDSTLQAYPVSDLKAQSIFEDCYGNLHLLSKDSCYQTWLNDGLQIIARSSLESYERLLEPCVGQWENHHIFYRLSNHRKKYALSSIDNQSGTANTFYTAWDQAAEKVSRQDYWSIIGYYHSHVSSFENKITNGVWDGNLVSLQIAGELELTTMITWYLKIQSKAIKVASFARDDELITIDYLNDSIYTFSSDGQTISQVKFVAPGERIEQILMDKMHNLFYAQTIKGGVQSLFHIDLTTGESERIFTLKETAFAENIQVFDNYVYFLKSHSGFRKLYRIYLE